MTNCVIMWVSLHIWKLSREKRLKVEERPKLTETALTNRKSTLLFAVSPSPNRTSIYMVRACIAASSPHLLRVKYYTSISSSHAPAEVTKWPYLHR